MKALIIGLGSIGRRHLANLRMIEPSADITVWRQHSKPEEKLTSSSFEADRIVYSMEDALNAKPDFAVIASPAAFHVETAIVLALNGIQMLVEKPLSDKLEGVDDLLRLCRERNLLLAVAYHLRFSHSLQVVRKAVLDGKIGRIMSIHAEVGQFLPEWRPAADYRASVSARRALGGGVVLELSHELDYVRWLVGEVKTVAAEVGRLSDLEIDVEDTAEIILRFHNGAIGTVHLNMAQRVMTRTCRIVGTEGTLIWNALSHQVQLFSSESKEWSELHASDSQPSNEMYVSEMQHFLRCVRYGESPVVSGTDGRRVLEIALAVKESSRTRRFVEL
jgi:predicted dehydrogenase